MAGTKEWFLLLRGKKEGPFSFDDLKKFSWITPDTLVWKKGFSEWVRAGEVKEFQNLFKDEKKKSKKKEEKKHYPPEEILTARMNPHSFFWLFVLLIIIMILLFDWFYFIA